MTESYIDISREQDYKVKYKDGLTSNIWIYKGVFYAHYVKYKHQWNKDPVPFNRIICRNVKQYLDEYNLAEASSIAVYFWNGKTDDNLMHPLVLEVHEGNSDIRFRRSKIPNIWEVSSEPISELLDAENRTLNGVCHIDISKKESYGEIYVTMDVMKDTNQNMFRRYIHTVNTKVSILSCNGNAISKFPIEIYGISTVVVYYNAEENSSSRPLFLAITYQRGGEVWYENNGYSWNKMK